MDTHRLEDDLGRLLEAGGSESISQVLRFAIGHLRPTDLGDERHLVVRVNVGQDESASRLEFAVDAPEHQFADSLGEVVEEADHLDNIHRAVFCDRVEILGIAFNPPEGPAHPIPLGELPTEHRGLLISVEIYHTDRMPRGQRLKITDGLNERPRRSASEAQNRDLAGTRGTESSCDSLPQDLLDDPETISHRLRLRDQVIPEDAGQAAKDSRGEGILLMPSVHHLQGEGGAAVIHDHCAIRTETQQFANDPLRQDIEERNGSGSEGLGEQAMLFAPLVLDPLHYRVD